MSTVWTLLGSGGLFVFIGSIVTVISTRSHQKATEQQSQFQNDIELNKYIRGVVAEAVEAATRPLSEKIDAQDEIIAKLTRKLEASTQKDRIMSRFIQRIYWWDDSQRPGRMPRLNAEEQAALDLDLFPGDTQPPLPAEDDDLSVM